MFESPVALARTQRSTSRLKASEETLEILFDTDISKLTFFTVAPLSVEETHEAMKVWGTPLGPFLGSWGDGYVKFRTIGNAPHPVFHALSLAFPEDVITVETVENAVRMNWEIESVVSSYDLYDGEVVDGGTLTRYTEPMIALGAELTASETLDGWRFRQESLGYTSDRVWQQRYRQMYDADKRAWRE